MDTFFGAVIDGKLVLDARSAFLQRVKEMDGNQVVLYLFQHRRRTNQQNRYYWGAVVPIVRDGMKELGVELSTDGVHELLKFRFLKQELTTNDGEIIQTVRSSTELTPQEFNDFIASIQQWSAEYLGIDIPDPNEQTTLSI
jgi:hypothetical protein